jgi:hypothetical protein
MVVPFSKLFFEPKNHFFPSTFLRDHYALILHNKYCKINLLFFVFTLQDSIKFSENGQKKCPKIDMAKPFCAKTRGTR